MALKGIKVLEFAGLAPSPLCGRILADFGASVIRIDRIPQNHLDTLQQGKRTLAVNLKLPKGQSLVRQLCAQSDVLIEPFRPGVMEKLNLGPERLCQENPRLIYARLTGFGQSGRLAARAGHDINYAAISGVLSMLGRKEEKPTAPVNILADFAGGGLTCALGICLALLHRHNSGKGQIVDAAMVDGAAYVASWLFSARTVPNLWGRERGFNTLDGGAFYYDTYETKDGGFMSVGALEPQFFEIFKTHLGLPELTQSISCDAEQDAAKSKVRNAFLCKTTAEWSSIFEDCDACVYPVLDWRQVMQHDHNIHRKAFQTIDGQELPRPAPRLSETPGVIAESKMGQSARQDALQILDELKMKSELIEELEMEGVIILPSHSAKL